MNRVIKILQELYPTKKIVQWKRSMDSEHKMDRFCQVMNKKRNKCFYFFPKPHDIIPYEGEETYFGELEGYSFGDIICIGMGGNGWAIDTTDDDNSIRRLLRSSCDDECPICFEACGKAACNQCSNWICDGCIDVMDFCPFCRAEI